MERSILFVVGRWGSGRKDTNVFGLFRTQSFNSIKDSWISEIRHHMPYTPFLIVGNKWTSEGRSKEPSKKFWKWRVGEVHTNCTQFFWRNFFCTENIFNGYLMLYCPALLIAKLSWVNWSFLPTGICLGMWEGGGGGGTMAMAMEKWLFALGL